MAQQSQPTAQVVDLAAARERRCAHHESRDGSPALDGQISESKLPVGDGFNLPRPPLGDLFAPHAHSLPSDAESFTESLVGSTKVLEDFIERDLAHVPSVSMLPSSVKPLTRNGRGHRRKLVYMSKRERDPWAVERGRKMKAARLALGKSQQQIADLAGVKDRETISQYESGLIREIDISLVPRLALALGLPPQQISREWKGKDETADLRVSPVARQLAYQFDQYPLLLQNEIRETIAKYEARVKQYGKDAANAMYTPPDQQGDATQTKQKRRKA